MGVQATLTNAILWLSYSQYLRKSKAHNDCSNMNGDWKCSMHSHPVGKERVPYHNWTICIPQSKPMTLYRGGAYLGHRDPFYSTRRGLT